MSSQDSERIVVISDIHMGADNGRGIFTAQQELAAFINHLTSASERIELVILGDALDYLQIEPYLDFTAATAKEKTNAIVRHNEGVFTALRNFLASGKRVRWCIGNHDIELLFPQVQHIIESQIAPNSTHLGGLSWHLDGGRIDYPLSNGRFVRLVHGNKPDPWNDIDYPKAKQFAEEGGGDQFQYPPGSKLVAHVINPLKDTDYRHLDLLKPEVSVALPLALALWPEHTWTHLRSAFPNWFDAQKGGARQWVSKWFKRERRTLGRGGKDRSTDEITVEELFVKSLSMAFADNDDIAQVGKDLVSLLGDPAAARQVEDAWRISSGGTYSNSWGARFVSGALLSISKVSNQWCNPWSTEKPDDLDEYVRNTVTNEAAVIIAGHTHLARAVSYKNGYYINTGTWANLMRIPTYLNGDEFAKHAQSLRDYFSNPELAPAELRPFQRFTYADVDLRPNDRSKPFRAELREWVPNPSRTVASFP